MTGARRAPREAGSATVFAALGMLAVLAFTALCVQVGGAVVARHRAQAAADLAALAAAAALADGAEACSAARPVARRNGAGVSACEVEGRTVLVHATASLPLRGFPGPDVAEAVARGGWNVGRPADVEAG
ncbi:Rv3654c family TadE-like protein [Tomitella fengzijianii]|uniref:Flp pilus-assembly TadE/G-like family protein n=1 Tax=Tomitella fengzijianii TaxID=2597660 RepID=A0A516X052_9ACTN|nr:Rv3654c family TadE-like protein [Tomitella fengzijianii]QDQ96455.1 flp pilus-assembly TadE/G-like family protein [Tomitella fengzijianii]